MLGLRTVVYHTADLEKAKQWYSEVLGVSPYFNEPYYVGFNVGGYELGLRPDTVNGATGAGGASAYWGVENAAETYELLITHGATPHEAPANVGGNIVVAAVIDPFGNVFGIIENPDFKAES